MPASRRCENCTHKSNRSADRCEQCGVSLSDFRHPLRVKDSWILRTGELAAAIPFTALQGGLSRSVTVPDGFLGYVVEHEVKERNGQPQCYEIGPGTETIQGWLAGLNQLGAVRRGMVYLARSTPSEVALSTEVLNNELLPIQVTVLIEIGIGNLPQFAQASMGGLKVYTRKALHSQLLPLFKSAVQAWVAEQSMRQLQKIADGGQAFKAYLLKELGAKARELGLELSNLSLTTLSHEKELGKRMELAEARLDTELYEEEELQKIERINLQQQLDAKNELLQDAETNSHLKRRLEALNRLEEEFNLDTRELTLRLDGKEREARLLQLQADNTVKRQAAADELRSELATTAKLRKADEEHQFELLQLQKESELARYVESEDATRASHNRSEESKRAEFERNERRKQADERRAEKQREAQAELDRLVLEHDRRDAERIQSRRDMEAKLDIERKAWELSTEKSGHAMQNLQALSELNEKRKEAKAKRKRDEQRLHTELDIARIKAKSEAGDAAWIADNNRDANEKFIRLREIEAQREMSAEQIVALQDPRAAAEVLNNKDVASNESEHMLRELLQDKDRMYERLERMTDKQREETLKLAEILARGSTQTNGGTVVNVNQAAPAAATPRCPNPNCTASAHSGKFCTDCGTALVT